MTSNAAQSFRTARDSPIKFGNYTAATRAASAALGDLANKDPTEILAELTAKSSVKKKLKLSKNKEEEEEQWSDCDELELSRNVSILEKSIQQPSTLDTVEDDDEWSECDELELSRNVSLLEQSINQPSMRSTSEQLVKKAM